MKKFKSIKEQIEHLKAKNVMISDDNYAAELLSSMNYYRLMGYALPFKKTSNDKDDYQAVPIEDIACIHDLDKELRLSFLNEVENIELKVRAVLAYHLGEVCNNIHNESQYWHGNKKFDNWHKHINLSNKNERPIIHHQKDIKKMPIWVIVEHLTLGQLLNLYSAIHRKYTAVTEQELSKIFHNDTYIQLNHLRNFRNKAAHFSRLFDSTSEFKTGRKSPLHQVGIKRFILTSTCFKKPKKMEEILNKIDEMIKKIGRRP